MNFMDYSETELAGLWKSSKEKCKGEGGIFLIHQNGKEITIHGIGIEKDKYDNIGFGKIDEDDENIYGTWEDTLYSANPENCKKHQFHIKIESENKLRCLDKSEFGYGDFDRIKTIEELKKN